MKTQKIIWKTFMDIWLFFAVQSCYSPKLLASILQSIEGLYKSKYNEPLVESKL